MQIRIRGLTVETPKQSTIRWLTAASCAVAGLLCAFLVASPALADNIGFDIGVPNLDLSSFPSPYAHVDVNRTSSTTADITFTGLAAGGFTYSFGAAQAIDVNVNATTFTVGTPSVLTLSLANPPGTTNVSQFGNFNTTFDNFDGFNSRFSTVDFTLTNTSGTWLSALDVLTADDKGFRAAAHIFATNDCEGACVTGFAGDGGGGPNPVPEPATLLLFGSSLLGLGFAGRKRFFRGRADGPEESSGS